MLRGFIGVCIIVLSLGAVRAADPPADKGPAELQGTWRFESLEVGGKESDSPALPSLWVVKDGKLSYGGQEVASFKADAKATPKSFDLTLPDTGKTYEGIYSIEKDMLKICINGHSEGVKERPTEFATKDKENLRLLEFRRDKNDAPAETLMGFIGLMLRLDDDHKEVVVGGIIEKTAAQKAGLQKDDVILKVGGNDAGDLKGTVEAVRRNKPGAELVLRIRRDGKEKDVKVTVGVPPLGILLQLE